MITWDQVSFSYRDQESGSLEQVDLKAAKGECILFCGRSGCGKTTMLRQINGLIPNFFPGEQKGTVKLEDQDVSELPMYRLAERVGSVFQNPRTQFFNVDTDSEIAFGIENEALPPDELRRRVEQTVKDLKIENLRGRSIFALSGGEKQKVAFASVYAMNPEIYVLDEPSSNLDMDAIEDLRRYLMVIKQQGKTILIAEHRIYYLMDLIDRAVYLEQGKITGIYTAEELLALSGRSRAALGLRAAELSDLEPKAMRGKTRRGQGTLCGWKAPQGQETSYGQRTSCGRKAPQGQETSYSQETSYGRKTRRGAEKNSLELKNVTVRYRERVLLEGINLQAFGGDIIAVTGQNGAGKTTFSRALCGLHKDCDGQFLWNGRPFDLKKRRKNSYLVMQDAGYELFAESVEKECVFGIQNPDLELADRTLEALGLSDCRSRHPNTLSGGQKQRLAVAVSMVCGRELLIFDEPTSGLDYDSMMQVAALMERLAEQGNIIFVVTHDHELICKVCTRIFHLGNGNVREVLSWKERR